jgi:hypothetical protein
VKNKKRPVWKRIQADLVESMKGKLKKYWS